MPYRHRARPARRLPRLVAVLSTLATLATVGAATSAAQPGPTDPPSSAGSADPGLSRHIDTVHAKLDRLSRQSAQLDEQYNVAAAAVSAAQRTAQRAQRAADDATASYRAAHARFLQAVLQQYESGPSLTVGNLLTSGAPQQYLDGITMDSMLSNQFAATVRSERALRAESAAATQRASAALDAARAKEARLAKQRAALRQESQHFRQLLDSLTAQQQRELARQRALAAAAARTALAGTPHKAVTHSGPAPVTLSGPVAPAIQRVIAFAEAQVGKSYSYGASGPYSFDCSGLTMASYAQAGVSLPHSAAEQYNYGTHVAYSQLQPGDLIFLYSPIGHVELYVGHDLAVSAANPATGVVYVHPSQDMGNYVGATRLIG